MCKAWRKKEGGLAQLALPDAAISDFEMLSEICSASMGEPTAADRATARKGSGGGGGGGAASNASALALPTSRATVNALESHQADMKRSRPELYEQLRKTAELADAVGLGGLVFIKARAL